MGLIRGIDGQFVVEIVRNVDVRERPRFAVLRDLLPFQFKVNAFFLQCGFHGLNVV